MLDQRRKRQWVVTYRKRGSKTIEYRRLKRLPTMRQICAECGITGFTLNRIIKRQRLSDPGDLLHARYQLRKKLTRAPVPVSNYKKINKLTEDKITKIINILDDKKYNFASLEQICRVFKLNKTQLVLELKKQNYKPRRAIKPERIPGAANNRTGLRCVLSMAEVQIVLDRVARGESPADIQAKHRISPLLFEFIIGPESNLRIAHIWRVKNLAALIQEQTKPCLLDPLNIRKKLRETDNNSLLKSLTC